MNKEESIVVIANGLFPSGRQGKEILENADKLICCDGAADKLVEAGYSPDVIIGDLDSVSAELMKKYASILIRVEDQETNDLTKAVKYCGEHGYNSVSVIGASGLREDHTLGNISLMLEYYPAVFVRIISDFGMFFLVNSGEEVKTFPGEKISVFSVDNSVSVTAQGLKYPLEKLRLNNWYRGSLNEAIADRFMLLFESELPMIVYRAW